LFKHARHLALTRPLPTFRRLVPGFEAPVNLAYSQRNRSAICRIPVTKSSKAKRVEFRAPDASSNPYLCFAAVLMAGLDGILNRIDPGSRVIGPVRTTAEEAKLIKQVPASLGAVLDALEADHEFLLKGDVFTTDLLEAYIGYKRQVELDPVRIRPTPYEFTLYFDC
jgi:glutamine synthetase